MKDRTDLFTLFGQKQDPVRFGFDPGEVIVQTDAQLAKPHASQLILGFFDHGQLFRADRFAVNEARSQAGVRRFVPGGEPHFTGERPDLLLAEAGIAERAEDAELADRFQTGAVVAEIVHVGAFRNEGNAQLFCFFQKARKEGFFAQITAVGRIGSNPADRQHIDRNDDMPDPVLPAEARGFLLLPCGDEHGRGGNGGSLAAQHFGSRFQEEGRIHTA